jgi:hypothetical protein
MSGYSIDITLHLSDNSLTTVGKSYISSHLDCTHFLCKLLKEAAFHGAEADPQSSLKKKF